MTYLYHLRSIAHSSCRIFAEHLLLCRRHKAEEDARLGIIIVVVLAEIILICTAFQSKRRLFKLPLILPLP